MLQKLSSGSLLYVADPMCSWCYAFGSQLERIRGHREVHVALSGLYAGPRARRLDDDFIAYLESTWRRVERRTREIIAADVVRPSTGTYDSGPASLAVIAVREQAPTVAVDYLADLQRAFYREQVDLTDSDVLVGLAPSGTDLQQLAIDIRRVDLLDRERLVLDRLHIAAVPELFLVADAELIPVAVGYSPADMVRRTIEHLDP